MITMRQWFYSWLAENARKLSQWAIERAYRHVAARRDRLPGLAGKEVYEHMARDYLVEAMHHDPGSLCRRYGIEQESHWKLLAENCSQKAT
jgi:hypothetical protein